MKQKVKTFWKPREMPGLSKNRRLIGYNEEPVI